MGAYNNIYVGVYMEVPQVVEHVEEEIFKHPDTGKQMKTKFCPDTGKEGIPEVIVHKKLVTPGSYIEDDDNLDEDMFFTPEYSEASNGGATFLLNSTKSKFILKSDSNVFNLNLENVNGSKLIDEFYNEFEDYIEYYRKKYKTVDVKFGVVHYAH